MAGYQHASERMGASVEKAQLTCLLVAGTAAQSLGPGTAGIYSSIKLAVRAIEPP